MPTINGTNSNDSLIGTAGDDQINGFAGNDSLDGGSGNDTMVGGTGDDIYEVDSVGDVVVENANEGTDRINSYISLTLPANVETLILYGFGNLYGVGNDLDNGFSGTNGDNALYGLGGDDQIYAYGGNDKLDGGSGNDTMVGGTGDDIYEVDSVGDVVVENANEGTDRIDSYISLTLPANVETLILYGFGNLYGVGNDLDNGFSGTNGDNALYGLGGDDQIYAYGGNDKLDGGSGNDTMVGGTGDDIYEVDSLGDVVVENANEGTDRIDSYISLTLPANVEGLVLYGSGDLNGVGNDLNNGFSGTNGDNALYGLGGDDQIYAYGGNDTLVGGAGNDVLDGGLGTDLAIYAGNRSQYTFSGTAANLTISDGTPNRDGIDTLLNIEQVQFADGTFTTAALLGTPIQPVKYYLYVAGIDGGSTDAGHVGWFAVNSSSGGFPQAGSPEFSPLRVSMGLNAGLDKILLDAASGRHFADVKLDGVDAQGQTVYGVALKNALISEYEESNSPTDFVAFDYGTIVVGTKAQQPNGSLGAWDLSGWDVIRNQEAGSAADLDASFSVATNGTAAQPVKYYLYVEGIDGGSTDVGHVGWFAVVGYGVGETTPVSYSGSAPQAGPPQFSPLSVSMELNAGLDKILLDAASGRNFANVKLDGVDAQGHTVYCVALKDAHISQYLDSNFPIDGVVFDYGTIVVGTKPQQPDGSLGAWEVSGWDLTRQIAAGSAADLDASFSVATNGIAAEPVKYYLYVAGIDGGSTDAGHVGWFAVDGYDVTETTISGRPEFSPLTVSMGLNAGLDKILLDAASGRLFADVKLDGVDAQGRTVYGVALKDALINYYEDSNSPTDSVSFYYGTIIVGTKPQQPDGSLGAWEVSGWDLTRQLVAGSAADLDASFSVATNGIAAQPVKYYLYVAGVDGGSTDEGHVGWFAVDGYAVRELTPITLGGGVPQAGRPEFWLTVSMGLSAGLDQILSDVGRHFADVRLDGVDALGRSVYGVALTDAHLAPAGPGDYSVAFEFGTIVIGTKPQQPDGSLGAWEASGWDLTRNLAAGSASDLTDSHPSGSGSISISINDVTITEGNSGPQIASFTVTRAGGTGPFSVNYTTADGDATAGSDYVGTSGTLNFGDGVNTQTVSVTINGDTTLEPNEIFFVNLSGTTNGVTITDGTGAGTIINDEAGIIGTPGDDDGQPGNPPALVGTSQDNSIFGLGGSDALSGASGNDTLDGGAGVDTMIGVTGNDTYVVDNFGDVVTENPGEGTDTVQTNLASYTLGANVENLTFTDNDPHTGTGNDLDNAMTGGSGDDTFFAGAGSDTLIGGDGDDTLVANAAGADQFANTPDTLDGGNGNDTIYADSADTISGGSGNDVVLQINDNPMTIDMGATSIEYIQAGFGNDTINAATQSTGVQVFAGGGSDTITGSNFDDFIFAGVGNDTVVGNDGADVILGDLGSDSLSGGAGNDSIYADNTDSLVDGGSGFDALYIVTSGANSNGMSVDLAATHFEFVADFFGGNDIIDGSGLSVAAEVYAAGGNDVVTGGSADGFLWGGSGNDVISGGAGNDVLVGKSGSDTLRGGAGFDVLYGSAGGGDDGAVDTFVFDPSWGTDIVFDFVHGTDKLDMTALHITFADLAITADGAHAHIAYASNLISVANAAGQITAGDFLF